MINKTEIERTSFPFIYSFLSLSSAYLPQLSVMKIINILLLLVLMNQPVFAQYQPNQTFTIAGQLTDNYDGYLFLEYENEKDSCLILNHRFSFKGNLNHEVVAATIYGNSSPSATIYLENKPIQLAISYVIKKGKRHSLIIDTIQGTETALLQKEIDVYINSSKKTRNYNQLLFEKAQKIITTHPQNPYSSVLFLYLCDVDGIDKALLRQTFHNVKQDMASEWIKAKIEERLFPVTPIKTNDPMADFTLPDRNGNPFASQSLKGKWIFIDFWASWCSPCRKQFSDLRNIYATYKDKNFEIIGVSKDHDTSQWIKALDKENLVWVNLIEHYLSKRAVSQQYGVLSLPMNFLINPEGIMVAKDLSMVQLQKRLAKVNR